MGMMPCMTGWAGLRQAKRGMDSTREIVRNNILKKVSRRRPTNTNRKVIKLHVSSADKNKAAKLAKNLKKRASWKIVCIVVLLVSGLSYIFTNLMIWLLVGVICLTVPYLVFLSILLAKRHRPYINGKMRNLHIRKAKVKIPSASDDDSLDEKRSSDLPDYVI